MAYLRRLLRGREADLSKLSEAFDVEIKNLQVKDYSDYYSYTVLELREMARKLDISNYSRLSKDLLIMEIVHARSRQRKV
jgi:hypothetical protein